MEKLVHSEKFNTAGEMVDHVLSLIACFGPTLRDSAVEIQSPDDRACAPYVKEVQVWEDMLSDSSVVYNLRIVQGEA